MTSHIVIRASAGTGKTFQLSNRYVQLLHLGAAPDRILATTFTRKAAAEILHRVILRLAEAAVDNGLCEELGSHIGARHGDPPWSRLRCRQLLRQMLQHLHRVRIGTLDSFFAQIARSFSLDLGLPAGWKLIDESEERRIRDHAIDILLRGDSAADVSRLMNLMSQGDAERSVHQGLRTTVDRLLGIFQASDADAWHRVPHQRMMTDDQFDEAFKEFERLEMPDRKRFQKAHLEACGLVQRGEWESFLGKGVAKVIFAEKTTFDRQEIPPLVMAAYAPLVKYAQANLVNQLQIQTAATYELMEKFDRGYRASKLDARALRFDDVTFQLVDNFQTGDMLRLEMRLDGSIAHLLLDEFQDTSAAQWQILRPFAQRITATKTATEDSKKTQQRRLFSADSGDANVDSASTSKTFFCVGDTKQAIYGWRGGDAELFDILNRDLSGLKQEQLTESFRSAQPIVDTVNQIFTKMVRHNNVREEMKAAITQWCANFPAHTTRKQQLRGYACLRTARRPNEGETSDTATVRCAVRRIEEIARSAPGYGIGVLARRNTVVAEIIHELRQRGVPASEEGGNPLTDSAPVVAVLSLLRLTDHPGDTVSRAHVAHSPLGAVVGLERSTDDNAAQQLAQRMRRRLVERGYGKTIYDLVEEVADVCTPRERRRLRQLVERAYVFDPQATLRITDFIRFIEMQRVVDPTSADIRVMTVHQAKGLQFDAVVLVDLDTQIRSQTPAFVVGKSDPSSRADTVCLYRNATIQSALPARLQTIFRESLERATIEEICVLYVAVTRAIHALYMIVQPSAEKLAASHAGLLCAALTDGDTTEEERQLYEHGEKHWFGGRSAEPTEAAGGTGAADDSALRVPRMPIRFAAADATRRRPLQRISPSSLEGGSQIQVGRILNLRNQVALRRGNLVHAWCEQIRWLDDGLPDGDTLRNIAAKLPTSGIDVDHELDLFFEFLHDPQVHFVLKRGSYTKSGHAAGELTVCTEQPFAIVLSNQLVTGSIDRLVLLKRNAEIVAADVIDFKTDRLDAGDADALEKRVQHYVPQLEAYRQAVSKTFRLDLECISTRLVFVNIRRVIPLVER